MNTRELTTGSSNSAAAAPDEQILRLVEQNQRVSRRGKALGEAQSRQTLMPSGLAAVLVGLGHRAQPGAGPRRQRCGERCLPGAGRTIEEDVNPALPAGERGPQHGGHNLRLPAEMLERFPRQRVHGDRAEQLVVEIGCGRHVLANQRHQALQHVQFTVLFKAKQTTCVPVSSKTRKPIGSTVKTR